MRKSHKKAESELNLTVIYEQDPATGMFIAHFEQFPDTYSQGATKEETFSNLCKAVMAVLESDNEQERKITTTRTVTREHVKFQLA